MKRVHLIAAVLLLPCVALIASADYCVRGHAVYSQPYVAPTYSYGYSYQQPYYQQPYYQQHYVPYAVPFHYSPDYYYSVSDYYRDSLLADAVVGRLVGKLGVQPPAPAAPAAPANPPGQVQPVTPPTPAPRTGLRTSVAPELVKSIETNGCMKCHAPGIAVKSGAGLSLDGESLATMAEGMRWKMHGLVAAGDMPKGGKAVPDAEVKAYYDHAMLPSRVAARK